MPPKSPSTPQQNREYTANAVDSSSLQIGLFNVKKMASSIAHEINNPLAVIRMNAELLSVTPEQQLDQHIIQTKCAKIIETVDHITGIIRVLRAFGTSIQPARCEWVQLEQLIKNISNFSEYKIKQTGIIFNMIISQQLPTRLYIDIIQISQAVINLVTNSYEAIMDHNEKWIQLDIYSDKDSLYMEVTDSGHGIPDDIARTMMLPFVTTKVTENTKPGSHLGLGLGLSLTYTYITNHYGQIEYGLKRGHTNFKISIPLRTPETFFQPPEQP